MDMSPQRVRTAEFKTARKGADLDEVRSFLNEVADELERAQNQSTAMEARARAAVARLQEVGDAATSAPAVADVDASVDESETISRTLLLAQRTADTTIADAEREAERIVRAANNEAATTRDSTREMAAQMLDEARAGARQAGEAERLAIAGEVEALKARRDFLESDVEQLEIFLADQRNRVREAATSLLDIAERVPGGLGDVRAPLLSASDDDQTAAMEDMARTDAEREAGHAAIDDDTGDLPRPSPVDALADVVDADDGDGDDGLLIVADISDNTDDDSPNDGDTPPTGGTSMLDDPWSRDVGVFDTSDAPTQAMPVVDAARSSEDSDGFRFTFDRDS